MEDIKMKEFKYVVTDNEGIHARPAGELVKLVKGFESTISIEKEGTKVDCWLPRPFLHDPPGSFLQWKDRFRFLPWMNFSTRLFCKNDQK